MPRLLSIWVISFVTVFCSCTSNNRNAILLQGQVDSTLKQVVELMSYNNQRLLLELQKKSGDPCTEFVAAQGLDFSDSLQQVSNVLLKKIDKVEDDLRRSGGSNDDFFIEQNKADELQRGIKTYKAELLKIDTIIVNEFADTIKIFPESIVAKGIGLHEGLIQLSNLKTQVYLLQNKIMRFLVLRTNVLCCGMKTISEFLVTQNSNIVFVGEQLEITAGLVTIEWQAKPSVSINNKLLDASSGKATYQMKVPDNPGKYSVPVRIQYLDQKTGQPRIETQEVHYTVIKREQWFVNIGDA